MNTLEIVCESCASRLRLSASLMEKIVGKKGRVTCQSCENKIVLDGSGENVVVKAGGYEAVLLELEEVGDASSQISLPPPLPEEALARRSTMQAAGPRLEELAAHVQKASSADSFEAPAPEPMRHQDDSLGPHSMDGDEEGMVSLGREFNSSPFASERDETYSSLYPRPAETNATAPSPSLSPTLSRAPAPPKAGQLRDAHEGSSNWLPWAIAAITVLALGVSLAAEQKTPIIVRTSPSAARALGISPDISQAKSDASPSASQGDEAKPESDAADSGPETSSAVAPGEIAISSEAAPVTAKVAAKSSGDSAQSVDPEKAVSDAEVEPKLPPFSSSSASVALREATALAASCRRVDDPTGTAQVEVTFAPSGRVTQASVSGPPFAGTQTGGCIAGRFRAARVPAFSGEHVTVTKTVTVR